MEELCLEKACERDCGDLYEVKDSCLVVSVAEDYATWAEKKLGVPVEVIGDNPPYMIVATNDQTPIAEIVQEGTRHIYIKPAASDLGDKIREEEFEPSITTCGTD